MSARPIDSTRIERLAGALMTELERELLHRPPSRDNVLICLNALALCVAGLLAGTDESPDARRFFDDALTQNLAGTAKRRSRRARGVR